jgi:hypothetical protein
MHMNIAYTQWGHISYTFPQKRLIQRLELLHHLDWFLVLLQRGYWVIRMVAPSVHNTKENQPGSALCHSKIPCCTLANSFSRKELNLYTVRMEKNCIHYSYVCVPFPGPTGYQQLTPKMHLLCVLAFAKSLVFAKIFANRREIVEPILGKL